MTDAHEINAQKIAKLREAVTDLARALDWQKYENAEYRGAIDRVQGIIQELRAQKQYEIADKLRAAIELPQIRFTTPKPQEKGE